jgi:Protein of unknown function (DUF3606)
MTDDRGASRQGDDERINSDDDADVARWAEALCTSPEEVIAAVRAVGCEVRRVKGYLFTVLVRRQEGRA